MIRAQDLPDDGKKTILRFFKDEHAKATAQFDVVATLVWEPPHAVWVHGMKGAMDRGLLRDLLKYAVDHDVQVIKAKRAEGRRLPGGRLQPNGDTFMYVDELLARYPFDSNFTPLS